MYVLYGCLCIQGLSVVSMGVDTDEECNRQQILETVRSIASCCSPASICFPLSAYVLEETCVFLLHFFSRHSFIYIHFIYAFCSFHGLL